MNFLTIPAPRLYPPCSRWNDLSKVKIVSLVYPFKNCADYQLLLNKSLNSVSCPKRSSVIFPLPYSWPHVLPTLSLVHFSPGAGSFPQLWDTPGCSWIRAFARAVLPTWDSLPQSFTRQPLSHYSALG